MLRLIEELLDICEARDQSAAAAVYHRDYVASKDKPYRKYKRKKKAKSK